MKTYIYISGLVAAFLFLGWLVALVMGLPNHLLMLVSGSIVFVFIYLPLVVRKRKNHRERMKDIIRKYKANKDTDGDQIPHSEPGKEIPGGEKENERKGWSMNNSPFRDRRSGVTWGGGNIHAADAARGSRKRKK